MRNKKGEFDLTRPVAIIGAGVMATKVAWACARVGLITQLFDIEEGKASGAKTLALTWSSDAEHHAVKNNLHVAESLEATLRGAQLGFENVPERLELKQKVHRQIGALLDDNAYLGSNASSLTCTPLAESSGRASRFFNLNFTDPRYMQLVELMTCADTASETILFAKAWARAIGMIPVWVRKEQLGYSFNRMWRVIKKEALRQIAQGYSTPQDIDRSWMLSFGVEQGPCGLMDEVGLHSILSIEKVYYQNSNDPADRAPDFLVEMVERGETGLPAGKGFYTYPNPEYRQPDFLVRDADD